MTSGRRRLSPARRANQESPWVLPQRPEHLLAQAGNMCWRATPIGGPYGTGALMKDLYGNKIYLNQD